MVQDWFEKGLFLAVIGIVNGIGILTKMCIAFYSAGTMRNTAKMAHTEKRKLKELKQEYADCSMKNGQVKNVDIFVDKYVGNQKMVGMMLSTWNRISGQALIISVGVAFVAAFLGFFYHVDKEMILFTMLVGIWMVMLERIVDNLACVSDKQEQIRRNLKNYFVNQFRADEWRKEVERTKQVKSTSEFVGRQAKKLVEVSGKAQNFAVMTEKMETEKRETSSETQDNDVAEAVVQPSKIQEMKLLKAELQKDRAQENKMTTEKMSSEKVNTEISEEINTEEINSEEISTEGISTEEIGTEEMISEEIKVEENAEKRILQQRRLETEMPTEMQATNAESDINEIKYCRKRDMMSGRKHKKNRAEMRNAEREKAMLLAEKKTQRAAVVAINQLERKEEKTETEENETKENGASMKIEADDREKSKNNQLIEEVLKEFLAI